MFRNLNILHSDKMSFAGSGFQIEAQAFPGLKQHLYWPIRPYHEHVGQGPNKWAFKSIF